MTCASPLMKIVRIGFDSGTPGAVDRSNHPSVIAGKFQAIRLAVHFKSDGTKLWGSQAIAGGLQGGACRIRLHPATCTAIAHT